MKHSIPFQEKFEVKNIKKEEIRVLLKENMEVIVGNIIRIKKEKNISHEALAFGIRSHTTHVSYILRSGKGITVNVLGRIAKAMDVSLVELVK